MIPQLHISDDFFYLELFGKSLTLDHRIIQFSVSIAKLCNYRVVVTSMDERVGLEKTKNKNRKQILKWRTYFMLVDKQFKTFSHALF